MRVDSLIEEWMLEVLDESGFSKERAEDYLALFIETLLETGFNQGEARVYLFLFFKGPKNAKEISLSLNINRRKTYRILKRLETQRKIGSTPTFPGQYYDFPFEELLDRILAELFQEAKKLTLEKTVILAKWKNLVEKMKT
jgi:sugar-specific transcriptional regulator TrmB